jgi:hypothetical protein
MAIVQRQPAAVADLDTDGATLGPRGAIGDNNPPPAELARDEFNTALDAALKRRGLTRARFNELVEQAGRAQATDDETTGRCGELVKSLRAAIKLIEEIHAEIKEPYLSAGREVDGLKKVLVGPLEDAKRSVEAKQGTYLREQEAKRQAEERRRRAIEEEQRRVAAEEAARNAPTGADEFLQDAGVLPIAAPVEEQEPIRGDFGAAVSGQKVWMGEVTDYNAAFAAVSDNAKVREAIDKAVAGMIRAGSRQIAGVRIFETLKASNR